MDDNHDEVEEDHDEVEDDHGAHLQVDLGWDSPLTWLLTAIFLDLGYYAFHRASHEVGSINQSWLVMAMFLNIGFEQCKYFQFLLSFACSAVFVIIIVEILSTVLPLLLLSIPWTTFIIMDMTHDFEDVPQVSP